MKKLIIIGFLLFSGLILSWYLDVYHKPVESISELIGQNYDYAHKIYFKTDPNSQYSINIKNDLNEFDGGILDKKEILTDSIVNVYTWEFLNHKKTIWIGKTKKKESQIIDAIRYKNNVKF